MKCPYVTPEMECYFKEDECRGPCPVLVVTNRKRCKILEREKERKQKYYALNNKNIVVEVQDEFGISKEREITS